MPTNGSCINLIRSGSNIRTVTSITPSKAVFLFFKYYTSAGLHRIRSSNFRSSCPPEKHYWPFLPGARRLNNESSILNLNNMWRWFQTKSKDLHGWAGCVDGLIRVVKQTDMIHIVPVGAIVGPAHSVRKNAARDRIDSVWLVYNHVDLDTYWTVY